jgi:hypothetical protein
MAQGINFKASFYQPEWRCGPVPPSIEVLYLRYAFFKKEFFICFICGTGA